MDRIFWIEFFGSYVLDRIFGSNFLDRIFGSNFLDRIFGSIFLDRIFGSNFLDRIFGSNFLDRIFGSNVLDRIFGSNFLDRIFGSKCWIDLFGAVLLRLGSYQSRLISIMSKSSGIIFDTIWILYRQARIQACTPSIIHIIRACIYVCIFICFGPLERDFLEVLRQCTYTYACS